MSKVYEIHIFNHKGTAAGGGSKAGAAMGRGGGKAGGGVEWGYAGYSAEDTKRIQGQMKFLKGEQRFIKDMQKMFGTGQASGGGIGKALGGIAGKAGLGGAVGGMAAAGGIGAVVAIAGMILKKMIENSEAVKAIRVIIDSTLGAILDTLFGSFFVLQNMVNFVTGAWPDQMAGFGELIKGGFVNLLVGIGKLTVDLGLFFKNIYWDEPIKQWNQGIDILRNSVAYMEAKGKLLGGYIDNFGIWLTAMPGKLQASITSMIDSGMSWLLEFGRTFSRYVSEGVMGGMNAILPGLGDKFGTVITGIGSGFSSLIGNLTSPFTLLQNTLGSLDFSPFSKFLKLDFSKVIEFFNLGDAFDDATKFVKSLTGTISSVTGGGDSGVSLNPLDYLP